MLESLSFVRGNDVTWFYPWLMSQPVGWLVKFADIVARVRHDIISRTLKDDWKYNIAQTNEIRVLNAFKQREDGKWIVDTSSKITMALVRFAGWIEWIIKIMGAIMWDIFNNDEYGWMDFTAPNDKMRINMLTCGGNLVHVTGFFGIHAFIETQDITQAPDESLSYENAPQKFVKQGLVGHNRDKETYWCVDQKRGDVIIPLMTDIQATIPISDLEFMPHELPFETVLWGRKPVVIDKVVFSGSNTWAHIGSGRWVLIEKMEVTGLGSYRDRRLFIRPEDWFFTCPVPVKGWTLGKEA